MWQKQDAKDVYSVISTMKTINWKRHWKERSYLWVVEYKRSFFPRILIFPWTSQTVEGEPKLSLWPETTLMLAVLPSLPIRSSSWSLASLVMPLTPVRVPPWGFCWGQHQRPVLYFQSLSFPSESPVPMLVSFISSSRRNVLYFFSIAGRGMTNIYLGNPKFSFCLCHMGQMCLLSHEANGKSSPGRNKSSYFIVTWEEWGQEINLRVHHELVAGNLVSWLPDSSRIHCSTAKGNGQSRTSHVGAGQRR